jgi:hypothetical protein
LLQKTILKVPLSFEIPRLEKKYLRFIYKKMSLKNKKMRLSFEKLSLVFLKERRAMKKARGGNIISLLKKGKASEKIRISVTDSLPETPKRGAILLNE